MTTTRFVLSTGDFAQDWSNAGLITADDNWSGVPSIVGYRGDDVVTATGVDPRTITLASTSAVVIDVNANQTNPLTFNTGGVTEFAITNPTISLTGSGTADAPSIVIYLDATGRQDVRFRANIRDLEASGDDAIQQVAVQYRVGGGNWINAAYVADATTVNAATQVTAIDVTLGANANNAADLEIRIITTNAAGNDENVGIDDIIVSSSGAGADVTPPTLAVTNPSDPDDGAVAVDANSNIVLRFTENVVAGTGSFTLSNGTDIRTIAVGDPQVSITGNVLTINPTTDLTVGTTYTLTAPAGIVEDAAGNDYAGLPAGALDFSVLDPGATTSIAAIQGAGLTSGFTGQSVTTTGIVTAVDTNGYYLQTPDAQNDGNPNTSDGIFVFSSTAPGVAVGDSVRVTGTVAEFQSEAVTGLTLTEIINPVSTVLSPNNPLPAAILIGTGGRLPPTSIYDNDGLTTFNPDEDAIDFYETLEGMRVTIDTPLVVGTTNSFGETFVVASGGVGATGVSARGGITISANDLNPERIQLDADSGIFAGYAPAHTVGDRLASVTGVFSYSFNSYEVLVTEAVTVTNNVTLADETTTLVGDATHITIASYNLENLDPGDNKFTILANDIVFNLRAPDIIGAQEIQDANGAASGGSLSGTVTAQGLIDAIIALGGPTYAYVEIAPTTANSTGGEPNGNIRNGYFYNTARVEYVAGSAELIADSAYSGSRSPLVADFRFNGLTIQVINLHSTSRGGSDPLFGDTQPPANAGATARLSQSMAARNYVNNELATDPSLDIVLLGDLNSFYFEAEQTVLTSGGVLTNLNGLLPVEERYSYLFEGNLQQLDNILITGGLVQGARYDSVHINAETPASASRPTDHDPQLTALFLAPLFNGGAGADTYTAPSATANYVIYGNDGADTLTGNAGIDVIFGGNDNDVLSGAGGSDVLVGGSGDDRLIGGAGNNELIGGIGNDIYVLASAADTIVEATGEGTDGVETALASYTLGSNVENLTFTGAGSFVGIGNGLDNVITGGTALDALVGGVGNDTLVGGSGAANELSGGAGNDIYVIAVGGDSIIEGAGAGTDTVQTLLSIYTLSNNVENLTYTGTGSFTAIGNGLNNAITGGANEDFLLGRGGSDTYTGGAGADLFFFEGGDTGVDAITDFVSGSDRIFLDGAAFAHTANFALVQGAGAQAATSTNSTFLYNSTTGMVSYDADGIGAGLAVDLTTIGAGQQLTTADFVIYG